MIDLYSMNWSYSRLNFFHTCKYGWYLQYIEKVIGESNAWSQYGLFIHSLMDDWAKGKLQIKELSKKYKAQYKKQVTKKFPKLGTLDLDYYYYNKGLQFLLEFEGFGQKEIVSSENRLGFKFEGLNFVAITDLLVRNEEDKLVLIDYKSWGKSKTQIQIENGFKQLYFYAIPIWKKYKEIPSELMLYLFIQQNYVIRQFDFSVATASKEWVIKTLDSISKETEFKPHIDEFFCKNLCNYRNGLCKYKEYDGLRLV